MDSKLIDLFREKVNDNGADFVLHRYRNINGKNQWSIIYSAMDWISVVVDEIDVKKLSYKNDNDSMLAPGGISHSGPGGNRQLWPDKNSQS